MATSGSRHRPLRRSSSAMSREFSNVEVDVCCMSGNAAGVCIMSNAWKDEQDPSLINFISAFLGSNSFRLNFVSISPDLIFNCGGVSIAFVFVTKWDDCCNTASIFNRVKRLETQFARLYVVATLSTKEQNDSFIRSYFQYVMEFGKPAFVTVTDAEMGFEKIAHSRGACKQQKGASKLKLELYLAIGSIEATAKTSKEDILANTDLSPDKAEPGFSKIPSSPSVPSSTDDCENQCKFHLSRTIRSSLLKLQYIRLHNYMSHHRVNCTVDKFSGCYGAWLDFISLRGNKFDAVIHFAALKGVAESVGIPRCYYDNNLVGTINLIYEATAKYNCKMMVFSSSATVYGEPEKIPCVEDSGLKALNPYGRTKG